MEQRSKNLAEVDKAIAAHTPITANRRRRSDGSYGDLPRLRNYLPLGATRPLTDLEEARYEIDRLKGLVNILVNPNAPSQTILNLNNKVRDLEDEKKRNQDEYERLANQMEDVGEEREAERDDLEERIGGQVQIASDHFVHRGSMERERDDAWRDNDAIAWYLRDLKIELPPRECPEPEVKFGHVQRDCNPKGGDNWTSPWSNAVREAYAELYGKIEELKAENEDLRLRLERCKQSDERPHKARKVDK